MLRRSVMLAAAAVLVLVSACSGSGSGGSQPQPADGAAAEPPKPKDPVRLVFYNVGGNFNAEGYWEEKFGKYIKAKFPHITPDFIPSTSGNLAKLLTGGEQIDVVFGSVGLSYNSVFLNNMQVDIEPLAKKYKTDLSRFEPKTLEMIRQMSDGKLYALPFDNQAAVIYYNKDLFDKFGVPYPKEGVTWDELYEMSVKLTRNEGGKQYYGLTLSPTHYFLRNQQSLSLVDPKTLEVKLANDEVKSLMNNIARFYQIPGFNPDKTKMDSLVKMFFQEQVSAMWTPISGLHVEKDLAPLNWDIVSYPPLNGKGAQPYPTFVYLNIGSKYPDEAYQVMDYLTSEEFLTEKAKAATFIPALNSQNIQQVFAQDTALYKGKNISAIPLKNMAAPSPQSKYYSTATTQLGVHALRGILYEGKDINTALREAEEAVKKVIQEDKNK
ncbi:extracellular solute-binding protein [Paenibacillus oceani]|uniref:Extracellular solute-binding protein n=1 Tax=Paenibacillus oceani TaxID=2772510 RepID=A0A927CEK4_9BACL|nr:extracellular solute-binding protein [Paenibacillus oceani]MBD2864536.1 extracellular solute-binding protein [Paenibacillus oceani]